MRKLLNTLYITTEDYYLSLKNGNVVVTCSNETVGQFPLINFEGIISFSYAGASPALMGECAKRNINLCFMTPSGRLLARTIGVSHGNVLLRREQYRIADDDNRSTMIAKNMIIGKVYNARWVVERTLRDHALRVDADKLQNASFDLYETLKSIPTATSLDSLRGIEGNAAARYFSVFNNLILNQKDDFAFTDRNRRPPLDRVNATLSFGYALLAGDCTAALETVGLDAYVGFMHSDRPGRASLALDLEEELRAPLVDRFVLTMINNRVIQSKHFDNQKDGAVLLNDVGRKIFLKNWQEKKHEEITHPFLKEKMPWGLVPYVQALLLARTIRKDLDEYPPFLWK